MPLTDVCPQPKNRSPGRPCLAHYAEDARQAERELSDAHELAPIRIVPFRGGGSGTGRIASPHRSFSLRYWRYGNQAAATGSSATLCCQRRQRPSPRSWILCEPACCGNTWVGASIASSSARTVGPASASRVGLVIGLCSLARAGLLQLVSALFAIPKIALLPLSLSGLASARVRRSRPSCRNILPDCDRHLRRRGQRRSQLDSHGAVIRPDVALDRPQNRHSRCIAGRSCPVFASPLPRPSCCWSPPR